MVVELPLWLVIAFTIMFGLTTIHLIVGDLLAKIIWKALKERERDL